MSRAAQEVDLHRPAERAAPVGRSPGRPLVSRYWRPSALIAVLAGIAVVALLGVKTAHRHVGTRIDDAVYRWLIEHVRYRPAVELLHLTDPPLTIVLLVVVAGVAGVQRHWRVTALAVISPVIAIVASEVVLKPVVHRYFGFTDALAFPSGHETGLASLTFELALLTVRSRTSRLLRAGVVLLLAVWTVGGAVGLVRNHYHYATDTIGALAVCLAVVLGVALLVDAVADRLTTSTTATTTTTSTTPSRPTSRPRPTADSPNASPAGDARRARPRPGATRADD